MKKIFFFTLFLFFINANAEDLKILSTQFPPYTYQNPDGSGAGAIHDVVVEIIKRLQLNNKIEFVPWARARFEAENKQNIMLIPLARTKEREEKYSWVLHVLDDPYVLVTLKNSKVNISSIEGAKNLKIGILGGSVADALLRELKFTNLEVASTDIQNIKKLKLGRIEAWVAPLSGSGQYKEEGGLGSEDIRTGVELTKLKEYVGASKGMDKETMAKWEKAFQDIKKDGTYQKIMKKYGMSPLP